MEQNNTNTAQNMKRIMAGMWSTDKTTRDTVASEINSLILQEGVGAITLGTTQRECGPMTFLGGRSAQYNSSDSTPLTWADNGEICTGKETVEWLSGYATVAATHYAGA